VFMRTLYKIFGENLFSGLLTNLGPARFPEPLASKILSLELLVTPTIQMKTTAAMISHGDSVAISFGSVIRESELERLFFTRLVKDGLHVKIATNLALRGELKEA